MLIVLSMHRSGSSLLTGLLGENGFNCGLDRDLIPAGEDNPKGFYEIGFVNDINESLLASGVNSHLIPRTSNTVDISQADGKVFDDAVAKLRDQRVNVLKDPRFCLTLNEWIPFLPEFKIVFLYRNPVEVAASLFSRHELPIQAGLALWEFYNLRASLLAAREGAKLISFDDLIGSPQQTVADIKSWYYGEFENQLSVSEVQLFDSSLVHNRSQSADLNLLTQAQSNLYSALLEKDLSQVSECNQKSADSTILLMQELAQRGLNPVTGRLIDQQAVDDYQELAIELKQLKSHNARLRKHSAALLSSRGVRALRRLYTLKNKLLGNTSLNSIDSLSDEL